ncbi:hypothetical protein C2G38_2308390 [Gigaspora rosea]|uniref:Uncharacterized protein n=1 Tax=Gigaspora rosea TaxID=44941 RepID=A0A397WE10_9GLOM|nr:hypothetical protein C2G38_2308390 [Gigaspora rosea]
MSERIIHKYFNRKPSEWNILSFLEECELEQFDSKIDCYIKSLECISDLQTGCRNERAKILLENYGEGNKHDYHLARAWNRGRLHKPDHSYQSTIVNYGTINSIGPIETMVGGTFITGSSGKNVEEFVSSRWLDPELKLQIISSYLFVDRLDVLTLIFVICDILQKYVQMIPQRTILSYGYSK